SYRWFAPEVCIGQGVLSLGSDVYAYGMTVLELFTHGQPYNNIRHTMEVVIRSAKGERPACLHDGLWALLGQCWVNEPSLRPTIEQVLERLVRGHWRTSPSIFTLRPASGRHYRNGGQKCVVSITIAFTSSNSAQFLARRML
ncbi:hypothetical protein C8J57DRAFT_1102381, partial [Mycena rebaudengoi]